MLGNHELIIPTEAWESECERRALAQNKEERAEISKAALIKLAFQIYRSSKLTTQERAFEEEGFILA